MYEWIILVVTVLIALNCYYDNTLFQSLYRKHRKYVHLAGILCVGLYVYASLSLQPMKWQRMVDHTSPYMPEDMRRAIHPVLDFTHRHFADQVVAASTVRDNPMHTMRTKNMRAVSDKTKKLVAAEQRWTCAMCKQLLPPTFEVDHVLRLEFGGSNDMSNLQALCPNCHRYKTMVEK